MTEINDHKTFWKRSIMEIITYTEGSLADIIQLARKDIISLITANESQKEEIASLQDAFEMLPPKNVEIHERTKYEIDKTISNLLIANLRKDIESQKAITKLAVKENELLKQSKADVEHNRNLLSDELQLAVKALEWYADLENHKWHDDEEDVFKAPWTNILNDCGSKAKLTLKEIERMGFAEGHQSTE